MGVYLAKAHFIQHLLVEYKKSGCQWKAEKLEAGYTYNMLPHFALSSGQYEK